MQCTVKQDFLSRVQQRLILECIRAARVSATTVNVTELGRVGKSGARLLLCRIHGSPLVVKIHNEEKIKSEYQAMKQVWNFFAKDIQIRAQPPCHSGEGALLYWYQGGIKRARELNEMVYDENGHRFRFDDDTIIDVFRKLWERCVAVRKWARKRSVSLRIEYADYVREPKARKVLSSILGDDGNKQDVTFLGTSICNPLWLFGQQCFDVTYKGMRGPVHGDLHANNVIIDAEDDVHLIDFAWAAKNKHVLVDYVLMENSLRFLLFPQHVQPDKQLEADRLLLKCDGAQELASVTWDCCLVEHYRRLGRILHQLRTQARPYLASQAEDGFSEYLATQFLILFGQISYPDYNQHMAARALGLIASELREKDFGRRALS